MMADWPEGRAVVYCEGAFQTSNGKTAHGLVRRTDRYQVLSVVDSACAGRDAGEVLEGRPRDIPIFATIGEAVADAGKTGDPATHLVVGLAPDGGRLTPAQKKDVFLALELGLHIDSGLHDFLSEDPAFAASAAERGLTIRDVRKPPPRDSLHFFSGKIEQVTCLKVALLGTDSAIGKRTTAWILTDALNQAGLETEMVGTGQTAWLQGARYGIILDSLINDFVAGEIEHAVFTAWRERRPAVIIVEGQGSLMNPAYPGGFEILAAARPEAVIVQHAPARLEYDGFPGYPLHRLEKQVQAIELISGRRVAAVTLNHEGLTREELAKAAQHITDTTGLPAVDLLWDGPDLIVDVLRALAAEREARA
ncbi:MAG: DUF1611 domain-containing protein [Thermodesulfobacteriota bacterium]